MGVVSVLVVITMILLTTFICFKKYCGSAYRSNLSGLTTKELFLEFGMALPAEMQSMDEEELSGVSPTSHPSRQLASVRPLKFYREFTSMQNGMIVHLSLTLVFT